MKVYGLTYVLSYDDLTVAISEWLSDQGYSPDGEWELDGYNNNVVIDRPCYMNCKHLTFRSSRYKCKQRDMEDCQAWKHTPCPDYIEEGE